MPLRLTQRRNALQSKMLSLSQTTYFGALPTLRDLLVLTPLLAAGLRHVTYWPFFRKLLTSRSVGMKDGSSTSRSMSTAGLTFCLASRG